MLQKCYKYVIKNMSLFQAMKIIKRIIRRTLRNASLINNVFLKYLEYYYCLISKWLTFVKNCQRVLELY